MTDKSNQFIPFISSGLTNSEIETRLGRKLTKDELANIKYIRGSLKIKRKRDKLQRQKDKTEKKPVEQELNINDIPQINMTMEGIYELLKKTELIEISFEDFQSMQDDDDFPIDENGNINLVDLLSWLSLNSRIMHGERIEWKA